VQVRGSRVCDSNQDRLDRALVRAIGQGDHQALETLYRRHGGTLLSYIIGQIGDRALAEEVLQDVMLAVWHHAANFRGESKVTTWLIAIARKRAISARQHAPSGETELGDQIAARDPGPLETVERQSEQAAARHTIQSALRNLPADQRETLELVFYHGLSGPEAADVLGVAPGTVKSRLHRAKTTLRRILQLQQDNHHG
jgi:RNA polymerase sigma-70 factor (ECF subfamily)